MYWCSYLVSDSILTKLKENDASNELEIAIETQEIDWVLSIVNIIFFLNIAVAGFPNLFSELNYL